LSTFVFGNLTFNLPFETVARDRLFRPEVDAKRIHGIRAAFASPASFMSLPR